MTKLEYFKICNRGEWFNTAGNVTWKRVDNTLYFQCSKGEKDWSRNVAILPTTVKIQGVTFLIPLGLEASWSEIKHIIKNNPCDNYVGYSLGAEIAALSSAYTEKPAIAFACPNFYIGGKKTTKLFDNVEFVSHDKDLVTKLPLGYRKGSNETVLSGNVVYPEGYGVIKTYSGHSPTAYKQLLGEIV